MEVTWATTAELWPDFSEYELHLGSTWIYSSTGTTRSLYFYDTGEASRVFIIQVPSHELQTSAILSPRTQLREHGAHSEISWQIKERVSKQT